MASKSRSKRIPFVDLQRQHRDLRRELEAAAARVLSGTGFILGKETEEFETEFAAYIGTPYAVGLANGSDALHLSLRALGIGAGDEVIVPAMTFAASAFAVSYSGAKPVFADIDDRTLSIDPAAIERALTPKTKAIMPVHLHGHPAPMDEIMDIARRKGLAVVEDACQAHGALYHGKRVGGFGDAGCFSFYPSKNLGACGDGGALVTRRKKLYESIRSLRNYGQPVKYRHDRIGYNSRLDSMQAAFLRVKLRRLDRWNAGRRRAASYYKEFLKGTPLRLPQPAPKVSPVYHVYAVRTPRRDALRKALGAAGISTGLHYDVPLHLQECFRDLGCREGDFPVSEKAARDMVSLPMFPEITKAQVRCVADHIKKFCGA